MWGTAPRVFARVCQYYPDRTAIVEGDRSLTYAEMGEQANRVAAGLIELGVRKGERVGMLLPNALEFVPTQYGIWRSGAVAVQMAARASAADHEYFLDVAQATTLIHDAAFDETVAAIRGRLPGLERVIRLGGDGPAEAALSYEDAFGRRSASPPAVELTPDDPAFVVFTSGTTGTPRGVLYSHETLAHHLITAGLEIADPRPGEIFAHGLPLTHYTQAFILPTFMRGGTNVILPSLSVGTLLDVISSRKVTATAVVPTIIYLLLDDPRLAEADVSTLRTVVYCGAPMAPDRLRATLEAFGPIFTQSYAGTEPGSTTCLRRDEHRLDGPDDEIHRLSSAGRPMFHVDVTIQDEDDRPLPSGEVGEICVRQPGQMTGYLDPDKNGEAIRQGWVHSGDIGYLDASGYLHIVDREKDMIITGGFNVFPRQIEDVLLRHPAVAQCAVIGVPDGKWGEAVKAIVVTRAGATVTSDDLIALVKRHKGSVWAPKTVDFAERLPVNPSGKIDKKTLRAPHWAGRERAIG